MSAGAYQTIPFNVAAGKSEDFAISGLYLACLEASLGTFNVQIDGDAAAAFYQGLKVRAPGKGFQIVTIINTDAALPLTGILAYGQGDITDSRLSVTPSLSQVTTVADVACAAGATTEVAAADPNRESVTISNLGANVREVRVGDI